MRHDQVDSLASEIIDYSPDSMVHIDHRPHIDELLKAIEKKAKWSIWERPTLYIHVYGDFTLYFNNWCQIEKILKKYKVVFICASDKQVSLVKSLLHKADNYVVKCPFPVNEKDFYYSEKIRESSRNKLQLKENQLGFVYTGRISYQKNILALIKSFSFFLNNTNINSKLYLAGQFDDIYQPFLGKHFKENEFFYYFNLLLDELPIQNRNKIVFLGHLNPDELKELYNGCDYYISLSVHNDEDYGMSPAEALCCGLPCILTDWGGFSSFAKMDKDNCCQLIPVKINNEVINYQENYLIKTMIQCASRPINKRKRHQLSKHFLKCISTVNIARTIKAIHNRNITIFKGVSELMEALRRPDYHPIDMSFSSPYKKYSDEFKELYNIYES